MNNVSPTYLRAQLLEQATAQGISTADALALVDRLTRDGSLGKHMESLDSMLISIVREAVRNHALAIVLVEQAKAAFREGERLAALNPNLVLTAVN